MEVLNVGAAQAPKANESGTVVRDDPLVLGDRARTKQVVEDTVSTSAPAQRVETYAKKLEGEAEIGGDVRADLIGKFRALMFLGALDTGAAADQAAAGLLGDASHGA